MTRPRSLGDLAVIAPVLAAEAGLVALWVGSAIGVAALAAGHLAVIAALAAWTWHRPTPLTGLSCAVTALMGPLGAAGMVLAVVVGAVLAKPRADLDRWFAELFPDEPRGAAQHHYQRIVCGRDRLADGTAIGPFLDVLVHGPLERQLAAVATMSRRFHPAFAPAMRAALQHPVPQVRVQAAAAAAAIENGFAQRLSRLQGEAGADAAGWLALARHYEAYATTGLLDDDREAQSLTKALEAYGRCLERGGDAAEIAEGQGRLLARLGRWDEATALAQRHPALRARPWYADHLFRNNRLSELESLMTEVCP